MQKILNAVAVTLILLLAVNTSANAGNSKKLMKKLYGTWTVSAPEAPYEYQEAEIEFYNENGQDKVKILTDYDEIPCKNLKAEKKSVAFEFEVEGMLCVAKLEYKKNKLEGMVETDMGDIEVTMTKKK